MMLLIRKMWWVATIAFFFLILFNELWQLNIYLLYFFGLISYVAHSDWYEEYKNIAKWGKH